MPEDYERLYDELSGHREKPHQSDEYDPDDPLGLSSGRVTCTMATLVTHGMKQLPKYSSRTKMATGL